MGQRPRDILGDAGKDTMSDVLLVAILAGICVVLFVCWACLAVGAEADHPPQPTTPPN